MSPNSIVEVATIISLNIPEEASQLVDFVGDFFEVGAMAPILRFSLGNSSLNNLLNSLELEYIVESNSCLALIRAGSNLIQSEEGQESASFNEVLSEVFTELKDNLNNLTNEDVATLIMIVICLLAGGASLFPRIASKGGRFTSLIQQTGNVLTGTPGLNSATQLGRVVGGGDLANDVARVGGNTN